MAFPQIPAQTSPFLWGALAGAIALAFIGFNWGGWKSSSSAERMAVERAETAIVAALTPICVTQFQSAAKAKANLAALKQVQSWEQADYVKNGGWATMPGPKNEPNQEVARACAEALAKT